MKNYEKIKQMSIEEMAQMLYSHTTCRYCPMRFKCGSNHQGRNKCPNKIRQWLESEAE